jgi:hypothetical protein
MTVPPAVGSWDTNSAAECGQLTFARARNVHVELDQ